MGWALTPWAAARALAAYTWNNSPTRIVRGARRVHDAHAAKTTVITSEANGLTIAYAGLPIGESNILQLLEERRDRRTDEQPPRHRQSVRWQELAAGHFPPADLVVIGAEEQRMRSLPTAGSLTAPFRLHLMVDLPPSPQDLRNLISRREDQQFRRSQREHHWTLTEDRSPKAFEDFYWNMHLPTMRNRHGDRSRTEKPDIARYAVLGSGTLLLLREAGEPIAGALCHWSKRLKTLTTRLLGVRGGLEEHYRSGAFKALYHLLMAWSCSRGIPRVDFYGTEALISKGIFQWKRRLGAGPVLPPNHFATKRLRVYPRHDTPALRDFLVANPLIRLESDSTMTPVYFTDAHRPPRLDYSAHCPGLAEPVLLDLDTWLPACREAIGDHAPVRAI
ncbi:GNAT family N-acetyltransferase [Kitasatospora sp. NPDC101157]|uniref:GNAT family N-acetyltransferase n=1 Tax=Kitasatospora sp. NPDC101157 TaxID=3364098 RepID=UPI00381B8A9C